MSKNRIGPFVLEENLRPDGRSSVYRAFHTKQRKSAAVRVLSAPLAGASKSGQQEFSQEGERLVNLRHPHIARCYGGALDDMQGYLVHELIEGESLEALLSRRGKLSWDRALEIARDICDALDYAHAAGVAHGALAPDKVMFAEPLGDVKVLDFRVDRASNPFAMGAGSAPRNLGYSAPEQLDHQQPITFKADLFSLGCIVFQMITGQLPHQADTPEAMLAARSEPPPRVSSIELDCPVWIDGIVAQLLQPDPEQRPFGPGAVSLAFRETAKKVEHGVGAVEHAAGGFSPLAKGMDREEAQRLLRGNEEEEPKPRLALPQFSLVQLLEKTWFLLVALVFIGALITWSLWPLSEEQLFSQGQALMETESVGDWRSAKEDYFEPLLKRYPDTTHRAEIEQQIARVDKKVAFNRMKLNLRFVNDPKTPGESMFREAWQAQNRGEKAEALIAFRKLVSEIDPIGADQPYVLLAHDHISGLEEALAKEATEQPPTTDPGEEVKDP